MNESFEFADLGSTAQTITFSNGKGEIVFTIHPGGVLVAGPGLSNEQATRELFLCMVRLFPGMMQTLASVIEDETR